jgi:hypothetical protein
MLRIYFGVGPCSKYIMPNMVDSTANGRELGLETA